MSDGDFEPKPGKTKGSDGKRALKYLGRVVVAARLATARTGVSNRRFDGSRIGRGASLGRLLSSRDRLAGFRARRAIVKTRLVRLGPKGLGTARAHLRYIQRDGVTREGQPGELYSADRDAADGKAFLERCNGDRHQFRFIVSAEDGAEYPDLKPFIRRLMTQVADDLEETLRRMGERGDIIRTMQRELTARRLDRTDRVIADPAGPAEPVVGRVIHRGFADEHRDRHYLIVDGVDGHVHYLEIGAGDATEPTPEGSVVRITRRDAGARAVDRTVAAVAAANDGRYSIDLHLRYDRSASEAFAEAHVRRLEAMRRGPGHVEREADGSWVIADDHVERAAVYERRHHRDRPVVVTRLSTSPVGELVHLDAPTWLDRELIARDAIPVRDVGFGHDVREAAMARRRWLIDQDLADDNGGTIRLRANALALLQRRELLRVAADLEDGLGKPFVEARSGAQVDGRLARKIELASGRYALIEKSREFTLVPWRPVLEKQIGKQVGGIVRQDGVNWRLGPARSGPEIS